MSDDISSKTMQEIYEASDAPPRPPAPPITFVATLPPPVEIPKTLTFILDLTPGPEPKIVKGVQRPLRDRFEDCKRAEYAAKQSAHHDTGSRRPFPSYEEWQSSWGFTQVWTSAAD